MKFEMYLDANGEWRWRLRAPNGRTLAEGAEGYNTKPGVRRSIASFAKHLAAVVPVEEVRVRHAQDVRAKIKVQRQRAAQRKAA